jgi:hypothetical protein
MDFLQEPSGIAGALINLNGLYFECGMAAPHGSGSSALLRSDGVEKGQLLFHVTAPAGWADDTALFVIGKAQLFCERLQTITAMKKI